MRFVVWLPLILFCLQARAQEVPVAEAKYPNWGWTGDMRLRAQAEKNGDNDTRWLERLRLRLDVSGNIDPELRAEVRLATGMSNRSANQNLGDSSAGGAPRRIFGLDLGFIEWKPAFFAKLYGGKIPQLHYRPGGSQILLDENNSLEGVGAVADYSWDENWRFVLATGSVIIRENYDTYYSVANTNNMINWAQARTEWKLDRWKIIGGAGFFNFTSMRGQNFSDIVTGAGPNGNTEGPAGKYRYQYLPRQYFLETFIPVGSLDTSLFAERIINDEVKEGNTAWWLGVSLAQKQWDAQIAYCEIKPDAVVAAFTNADFAGGTTDSRGWAAAARWKFAKNMSLRITEFINRTKASTDNKEYNRTHIDLNANF